MLVKKHVYKHTSTTTSHKFLPNTLYKFDPIYAEKDFVIGEIIVGFMRYLIWLDLEVRVLGYIMTTLNTCAKSFVSMLRCGNLFMFQEF